MRQIQAGELRQVVQIQRRTLAADSVSGRTVTWTTYATRRAKVEPLTGRKYWQAQAQNSEVSHTVTMRPLSGMATTDRILLDSRVFEIASPARDIEERGRVLVLQCKEVR